MTQEEEKINGVNYVFPSKIHSNLKKHLTAMLILHLYTGGNVAGIYIVDLLRITL